MKKIFKKYRRAYLKSGAIYLLSRLANSLLHEIDRFGCRDSENTAFPAVKCRAPSVVALLKVGQRLARTRVRPRPAVPPRVASLSVPR